MTTAQGMVTVSAAALGRGRRLAEPALALLGAAGFFVVIHAVDPNSAGAYPTCPWLAVTGTFCPGCGTLRAMHALTNGDLGTALARNPLAVVSLGVIAGGFSMWTFRLFRGKQRSSMAPAWMIYSILWLVVSYWVLRNVPGWAWLSPA